MLPSLLLLIAALGGSHTLGPWTVTWSDDSIAVTDGKDESLRLDDTKAEDSVQEWAVLSVVGPWLSTEHTWYAEGGAHPSYGTIWETRDITRSARPVSLTDLWDDAVVLDALLADTVVQKARPEGAPRPATAHALLEELDGGCEMDLGPRLLTSWALHSVRGDQVAVRIGVTHGCEANRGAFAQLGLLLPIPDGMKAALADAEKAGTLFGQRGRPGKK